MILIEDVFLYPEGITSLEHIEEGPRKASAIIVLKLYKKNTA